MVKLIVAALIIILIGAGLYVFVIKKGALPLKPTTSTTESQVQPQVTGSTATVATSPEDDVNSLNQDLQEFDKTDASFTQDLNNL